ncbi:MFS transporter [Yersinia pekkanenii]|uniref:Membrane transport protein n=1 Tax=Yersinia pekkanenii TaxID=1288385 RepID=A0A0T9NVA0_9GAMM|nr:MFS transporter [Yersinia pekkanenii]CNH32155.1 putative membrane transport protein [Yersinia pekkanenii]CRY63015.1 putative membrane transport protein [Yersinia pekkanenii]
MNIKKSLTKQNIVLSLLFFIHGIAYASLIPWIPELKGKFQLSNYMVGIMISAIPAGAIILGLLSKHLINYIGLYWATIITFVFFIVYISIIPFASSWHKITLLLFMFGVFDAWADTCMNVQALEVQRSQGQSLINRFHGAESIGTIFGGLIAVSAIGLGLSMGQFSITILSINTFILVSYIILFRRENLHNNIFTGEHIKKRKGSLGNQLYVIALILLVFTCGIEETASIWGAIYMKDYYNASPVISGLPYLACQISMVIGRVFGDYFTNKLGEIITLKYGIIIATLGIITIISIHSTFFSILGFSLIGLGISVIFPLIISFIGQLPNINAASGITFATWMSRVGLLLSPPLIGLLADMTSLRFALISILIGCISIFSLINILSNKLTKLDL